MRNTEYDYDEMLMSESVPTINVPSINSKCLSARSSSPFLVGLERILEDEQRRQHERVQELKEKQKHIGEKVARRLNDKERKIKQLENEQRKKLYAQCTFKPNTDFTKPAKKGQQKRSFNQFLHQQKEFTNRVAQKRTALKESLDAKKNQETYHPKIKGKAQRTNKQPVYERLYALKDKENDDYNQQERLPEFKPTITQKSKKMARKGPIDQLLYGDAVRRQEKAKIVKSVARPDKQTPNYNNERFVAQKLMKKYCQVIDKLEIAPSSKTKIDYMMFGEIMKEMGFVLDREDADDGQERALLHDAYQYLEGFEANSQNVCVFILALSGIFHINPLCFEEDEEPVQEGKLIALDETQGRKLQKYFDLFKRNKLFSETGRKEKDLIEAQSKTNYSFHPQINKVSEEMAQKHREQMLEQANKLIQVYPELEDNIPSDGVISHTDLLVLHSMAREIKLQEQRDAVEDRELDECTFKPSTISNTPKNQTLVNSKVSLGMEAGAGHKKSMELYNNYKSMQSKKESLQASRQFEDPVMKECTFAPNLHHPHVNSDPSKFYTKQVEETLYRMRKGREQREQKREFLKRGQPQFHKDQVVYEQSVQEEQEEEEDEEETPTLLLDVNLGEKMDRITLYKRDEERLQEVAHEFALKHGLDAEDEQQLLQLLQDEIDNLLEQIDEDEEQSDGTSVG